MSVSAWVALVHHPVLNHEHAVVATAITNLDVHDIARVARTYGLQGYFVVTPIERQRELVARIIEHWCEGHGAKRVPERADAMRLVETAPTLEDAVCRVTVLAGRRPLVVATCARPGRATIGFTELRGLLRSAQPVLLVLGTGWGLADEILFSADHVLDPVTAPGSDYNHLSVRTAAAVIMDRLLAWPS